MREGTIKTQNWPWTSCHKGITRNWVTWEEQPTFQSWLNPCRWKDTCFDIILKCSEFTNLASMTLFGTFPVFSNDSRTLLTSAEACFNCYNIKNTANAARNNWGVFTSFSSVERPCSFSISKRILVTCTFKSKLLKISGINSPFHLYTNLLLFTLSLCSWTHCCTIRIKL